MPNIVWAGRFQAVSDRFRTEALTSSLVHTNNARNGASSPSSDKSDPIQEPIHDEVRRNPRVYKYLESLCTTDEARQSLADFISFMAARDSRNGAKGAKVREKQGWLQGLMGKKKGEGVAN